MRPVNLIPPEERRGEHAPLRTGPLPYLLLAGLVAVLVGITAVVLLDNQIADSKAEVATLEGEDAAAATKAQRLAAYTQFRSMSEQRVATVSSLADSRFDWERVMRELALVLPKDVWLVGLTATASADVSIDSAGGSGGSSGSGAALRSAVPGPAMEVSGCATGQEAVAGFVTALKDIDGVTRVGVQSSELGEEDAESTASVESGSASGESSDECRTRNFIAKFEIVVAFDAAPLPATGEEGEEIVATPTEKAETSSSETTEASAASAEGAE
jgi:Tfp pilus assembly protein PilN